MKKIVFYFMSIGVLILLLVSSFSYASIFNFKGLFSTLETESSEEFLSACSVQPLPFREGFEKDSPTVSCWIIEDANNDKTTWDSNIWKLNTMPNYMVEGGSSMYFSGGLSNNDWLISPTFKLDATKVYQLIYKYKTTANPNEFEVLASNTGIATTDFIHTVVAKQIYKNAEWVEQIAYITNLSGDVNIAWHVTTNAYTTIGLDAVSLREVPCVEPEGFRVDNITTDQAQLHWVDVVNTSWEYIVKVAGGGTPTSSGISVNATTVLINKDYNGSNLLPNTTYEYYIRSKCDNGSFTAWIGPMEFTTNCVSVVLPFTENFDSTSSSFDCWRIIDGNKDALTNGVNRWNRSGQPYQGDGAISFQSTSNATKHDDWLISPSIEMNGEIFAITYYYKTVANYDNKFSVRLSTSGLDVEDFTLELEPSIKRNASSYVQRRFYVQGITETVHVAWHVDGTGFTNINIDNIKIEKVSCLPPDLDVSIINIGANNADISWNDNNNTSWEYYVQAGGTPTEPVLSGNITSANKVTVRNMNGTTSTPLQPNTSYDFYVRARCSDGTMGLWIGPYNFRTLCSAMSVPFAERFNVGENNYDCWLIVDANKDANGINNIFNYPVNNTPYEGNAHAGFNGLVSKDGHDDWLISPSFNLSATDVYRLTYYYKTSTSYKTSFDVMLSTEGRDIANFKKALTSKKDQSNGMWTKETLIISGVSGEINIGWHVKVATGGAFLGLDLVELDVVKGCAEPMNLNVVSIGQTTVDISWEDNLGSAWEYLVQDSPGVAPSSTVKGTSTTATINTVTTDYLGVPLKPNTKYEYYVRTVCSKGESVWTGPFVFRTNCMDFQNLPYWEGFNANSKTVYCWTILDANGDSYSPSNSNIWKLATTNYEGTHMMFFHGASIDVTKMPHDDYLISPTFKFDTTKKYRLKYEYKTLAQPNNDYEFEVLLSNTGIDPSKFDKIIVPKAKYAAVDQWMQEYVFIEGVGGNVNLAWHVTSSSPSTFIYIDNIFIEEITTCPEPMELGVENEEAFQVDLVWTDSYGATAWEYVVQKRGTGLPVGAGIPTNTKSTTVAKDFIGQNLEANTPYEYYVRTVCASGETSIWNGPFQFVTLCAAFDAPFWEGFNLNSTTLRCWTVLDATGTSIPLGTTWKTNNSAYEGDMALQYYQSGNRPEPYNDWLISPMVTLNGGLYVLKYHFKTNTLASAKNEFEVLLSSNNGTDISSFKKVLVPAVSYNIGDYTEQVVFIDGVVGEVNIGWHIISKETHSAYFFLDNVSIAKEDGCPEPYYVKISNATATSIDLNWQQDGGIVDWEIIVVPYGEDADAIPIQTVSVSGNPSYTITGLNSGVAYSFFVRSKCADGITTSNWSTVASGATLKGADDDCSGAVNIPVNKGMDCEASIAGSLLGATKSAVVNPICNNFVNTDVWFKFTAVTAEHLLSLTNLKSISGKTTNMNITIAVYDQACSNISNQTILCKGFSTIDTEAMLTELTAGATYYIRIGHSVTDVDLIFNLCITAPESGIVQVSPSGDQYTVEELIKDVLVQSECDLVTNVNYQNGDGGSAAMAYNTLGYFSKSTSDFPFEEGIILSTNEIQYVDRRYMGYDAFRGMNNERWIGDKAINDAIDDAGGGLSEKKRVTQLMFDFVSVTETISFEYIFASNSYHIQCGVARHAGALFAAWLIDSTTGEGQNLAKVKDTDLPIAINTITDSNKSGSPYPSVHPEWFGEYYDKDPKGIEAPADFVGFTKAMKSEDVKVIPGRKYHIRLAVIDFCETVSHSSAVFFNSGSFNLGRLDLGEDMLVATNNALCENASYTINSGLGTEGVIIEWYRNGVLIPSETTPNLIVNEEGIYKVIGRYVELNCETSGEVKIEEYPALSKTIHQVEDIIVCRQSLEETVVDLTLVETGMFAATDRSIYTTGYYKSAEEAETAENAISNVENYALGKKTQAQTLYIRIENTVTGCHEVFELHIQPEQGAIPSKPSDVSVCAEYVFPEVNDDQYYYTEPGGEGQEYKVGDVLTEAGEYTIYLLQVNSAEGCYEETSYKVNITASVVADVFESKTLSCEYHTLAPLSEYNNYYTEPDGKGDKLSVGMQILQEQIIYVYASSDDKLCTDESSFTIDYEDCPIPRGISPNGDNLNDSFDLTPHGVESIKIYNRWGTEVYTYGEGYTTQWHGQSKSGKQLPDGTYYYVIHAHGKIHTGWVQINK